MPIIVFYRQQYGIDSMCFIDNTWFQMRSYPKVDVTDLTDLTEASGSSWWSFTHIDPMMKTIRSMVRQRIFSQQVVRDMLAGKMWVTAKKGAAKSFGILTGTLATRRELGGRQCIESTRTR